VNELNYIRTENFYNKISLDESLKTSAEGRITFANEGKRC
jgi:hypothetical protein